MKEIEKKKEIARNEVNETDGELKEKELDVVLQYLLYELVLILYQEDQL